MSVLQDKKILLAVSGGIAAYKTAFLVRDFIKQGAEVKVIMTPSALEFVTPLTLSTLSKNPVYWEWTGENAQWNNHVELGLWADYLIVAPATANTLSKMASGEVDNLVLATYLSAKCPVFVAPAMDLDMYTHPSTQKNFQVLEQNGVHIIPADSGELASGLIGQGRMREPEEIVHYLEDYIKKSLTFSHKKVLITAGPTYEPIDPVRFIGNHSSGKMGYELAREANKLGADVVLISGPSSEKIKEKDIQVVNVMTAQEMFDAVFSFYTNVDVAIMSAAVADFRPENYSDQKIKKGEVDQFSISLVKNPDILKTMGENKTHQYLVGFALETQNEVENAKAKLVKKNLDLIVLNSLQDKDAGFKKNTNKVSFIDKNGLEEVFPVKTKKEVARDILDFISNSF